MDKYGNEQGFGKQCGLMTLGCLIPLGILNFIVLYWLGYASSVPDWLVSMLRSICFGYIVGFFAGKWYERGMNE